MDICLKERTEEHVRIYFERSSDSEILKILPRKAQTVDEAVEDYRKTLLPDAASYGNTVYADGIYVGNIWCYCIDPEEHPNCMISFCIFEKTFWSREIASRAVGMFIEKMKKLYRISSMGAFSYAENTASICVLKKNGFTIAEEIEENGVASLYLERAIL